MSKFLKRALYVLYVVVFVVLTAEIALRGLFSDPEYYWKNRFSFVSPKVYQNHGDGLWTYRPHAAIREVAVYATAAPFPPEPRIVVEYDCHMASNNLGLLQEGDVEPGTAATVIVGDSFTAGQGGCPWFGRLQAIRKNDRLVNGGLLGTGFEQWRRLVVYLQQRGVVLRRLLVIAINDDFKRTPWNWRPMELACLDDGVCPAGNDNGPWLPVATDESHAELIARTAKRFSDRFPEFGRFEVLGMYLKQHSYFYKFADRAGKNLKSMIKGTEPRAAGVRPENEAALDWFKALGIPFQVLMVTQRNEAGRWWRHPDSETAVAVLEAHAVPYSWCRLGEGDFMPNDGHPNRAGYDKLVACAQAALDRMAQ
jgi:hypothetical protein